MKELKQEMKNDLTLLMPKKLRLKKFNPEAQMRKNFFETVFNFKLI